MNALKLYSVRRSLFAWPCFIFAGLFATAPISAEEQASTAPSKETAVSEETNTDRLPHHASEEELSLWIEQLGSPQFQVREWAAQQLASCDSAAIDRLRQEAAESNDLEVKARCLAIADALHDSDVGKRTTAFLREIDPQKTFGFEAWIPFTKLAGSGRLAKRLFTEIIEQHPKLAESNVLDPDELADQARRLSTEIFKRFQQNGEFGLGDAVSILYLSIRLNGEEPNEVLRASSLLVRMTPFTTEIRRPPLGSTLRKLMGEWIQVSKSPPNLLLQLSIEYDRSEGIEVARRVLQDPNCDVILFRFAMAAILRFGNRDDLGLLASWRNEERLLIPPFAMRVEVPMPIPSEVPNDDPPNVELGPQLLGQPISETRTFELRYQDLALAASAKLAGMEDLHELFPRIRSNSNFGFIAESLAFPQDDQASRQKAIDAIEAYLK